MAEAKFTTDHDEIREWAEARGGRPAAVRKTHAARLRPFADFVMIGREFRFGHS